jgi:hypothetical protein
VGDVIVGGLPHRLRAAVVELGRLADDDGPGAQDEDSLQVGALGHLSLRRTSPLGEFLQGSTDDEESRTQHRTSRVSCFWCYAEHTLVDRLTMSHCETLSS